MRNSSLPLLTLAAFTAATLAGALSNDSAAQSTRAQARPAAPAQVLTVKPAKPPRELRLQAKPSARPVVKTHGKDQIAPPPKTPSQLANLVVIPYYNNPNGLPEGFPTHSYCKKKNTGGTPNEIWFYIRNAGGSDTGSFQWNPFFPNAGAAPANVIANIPAYGQKLIKQGIPNGCYTPGFHGTCEFSIKLDFHDEVEEWSEANTYESFCVAPAG